MKINNINDAKINVASFTNIKSNNKTNFASLVNDCDAKQQVFASNICFRGEVPLRNLINDYKWFINNDKIPAINSFLRIQAPKESMSGLLRFILSSQESANEFLDSIIYQPRNANKLFEELEKKLPEYDSLKNFYFTSNPYFKAYNEYIAQKYEKANSISELLKIRPDWDGRALLYKHKELYQNENFFIGSIPADIGSENYKPIIEHLNGYLQFGFKTFQNIEDLIINGRRFKFESILDGKSDKNVFIIILENEKKYVVKIAKQGEQSLNDPFALGTCCKIDEYLTLNKCRNSAPLKYYDHNSNSAIYDYINRQVVPRSRDVSDGGRRTPDFKDLGLESGDTVGENNYFLLDSTQDAMKNSYDFKYGVDKQELISVDNDHVVYDSPFNILVRGFHKRLPNAMTGMFI